MLFIANFGIEHSKEKERSFKEIYELVSLTIWIKSFRIVRAFSCYVTSFQTDKTLGKRKRCVRRKQNFIGWGENTKGINGKEKFVIPKNVWILFQFFLLKILKYMVNRKENLILNHSELERLEKSNINTIIL